MTEEQVKQFEAVCLRSMLCGEKWQEDGVIMIKGAMKAGKGPMFIISSSMLALRVER